MLDLLFLGTSAGVPSPERGMPCLALRWKGSLILWDVGECCQRELMKAKMGYGSISHIFISHLHLDHFLGLYGVIETLNLVVGKEELHIHAPKGLEEILLNQYPFLKVHVLRENYTVKLEGAKIRAFRVRHSIESYGFVFEEEDRRKFYAEKAHALGIKGKMFREIEEKGSLVVNGRKVTLDEISYIKKGVKVAYSGDTMYSKNLVKHAKEARLLIHEATFHSSLKKEAKERAHSTAEDAGKAAAEAKAKELILTHISARYKGKEDLLIEDAAKHYKGPIKVAYDGMKIKL